jgi:endonuclease/exonuclease/phosphatase family metal-dependent hydrolase
MPITTPQSFGAMPADVAYSLALLSDALDRSVPGKQLDRNLIVASWNIRELGRHNGKWTTSGRDSPKRNIADIHYIAEIVSRFDVVAVQEVQDNLEALRAIMSCLGPDWGFHVTDVSFGDAGDRERLAYLYDLRRVRPSGLAGELVLSPEDLAASTAGAVATDADVVRVAGLARQLVKTPYMVSFTTASRPFVLTTAHIVWGKTNELEPRAREAEALTKMLNRAVQPTRHGEPDPFRASMIAVGDFNCTSPDDIIFKALVENGLQPDIGTLECRRTVSDRPGSKIAYDQIAWFAPGRPGALRFPRLSGDTFPWNDHVLQGEPGDTTFRISDHYPLWLEFSVREAA